MEEVTVTMKHEKSTKGAHKFQEELPDGTLVRNPAEPGAVVGSIYLRKAEVGEVADDYIEVVIRSKS